MRILVLLNRIPYPLNDGGAICSYHAIKGYVDNNCEVHCLAMNTVRHHVDMDRTGDLFKKVQSFTTIRVDNRITATGALMNLLSGGSYVVDRFKSKDFEMALIDILKKQKFDVVHLDGLSSCLYIDAIRMHSRAKIAYRAHNVEYKLWERASTADANPIKGWYVGVQARRLKVFEKNAIGNADAVLAISREDEGYIHTLQPKATIRVVPAGLDIDEAAPVAHSKDLSLFFIGALDWLPNLQGLDWFLKDVWPSVHQAFPDLEFHIAGKKMPQHFYDYKNVNIIAHGEVLSSREFMNSYAVLVSPLVSGSGVRIKIVEAMGMGKAILSTTVSAEGSGAMDGYNILIADTPEQFITQIKRLKDDPAQIWRLAENAKAFAIDNFQNKTVIGRLVDYYQEICR